MSVAESQVFVSTEELIAEMRAGRMVVLVDDENRENEGDLVLAAEKATSDAVNFMRVHTGGVICLAMTNERAERLGLPSMVSTNTSTRGTPFTVSVDAREGVTTGISAADRARTLQVAAHDACRPEDLVRPGHVFPLRAKRGGARLERLGPGGRLGFLDGQLRLLLGQPGVLDGEQRQLQRPALGLEGLVLLGLPRLALERAELTLDLVHDVANP